MWTTERERLKRLAAAGFALVYAAAPIAGINAFAAARRDITPAQRRIFVAIPMISGIR